MYLDDCLYESRTIDYARLFLIRLLNSNYYILCNALNTELELLEGSFGNENVLLIFS